MSPEAEATDAKLATIILAAGKGTRMKSSLAKVMHPLFGKPLLSYSAAVAREAGSGDIVAVIGHQAELIEETMRDEGLAFVLQKEQLGTGHAVLQTRDHFRDFAGTILILCGDVPLLKVSTVRDLLDAHHAEGAAVTVLTTLLDQPSGYGRVIKGEGGNIVKIVEERDATEEEKEVREINTGIYAAESSFLFEAVAAIDNKNAQGEYYLTDMIALAIAWGKKARSFIAADSLEVMGINTREDLDRAEQVLKDRERMPSA